ncbi:chemotaxis protein methyltransferase (plasmid) [Methylosinus sp. C49]|nr:chemotaxis protein methyltransferase [Methylosinus sp. C49]
MANLDEYVALVLDRDELGGENMHLIDCVTTNKTDFFREPEHFEILTRVVMPHLLDGARRRNERVFKFWSAAASIGAEAYTLAMVLADLSAAEHFGFRILGTDICSTALAQAQAAIYPEDMLAPTPKAMRERYVMSSRNSARREVRIVPELRRLVRFQRLNLMDATYPIDEDIDVIFCRNVLIYFSSPTQQAVVANLCRHLRPGGFLFLGHSESMAGGKQASMRQIASTVFRKEVGRT